MRVGIRQDTLGTHRFQPSLSRVGKILVAIEVEAGHLHPDAIVGEYWSLSDGYREYGKIALFHVYAPDYLLMGRARDWLSLILVR